ncbi:hypothetical protein MBEHAL_2659 [Halarchaeum acidiphilum MH1-52-1]|uniref:Uncharacterized protein n=1 Tax=Halarchaeum acidiphilum MH1-52-1 TaxID=1261545 RepID=U3A8B4_9EURY|nr:hypothetical protein MBEHAL_2659 [Halarchaeum acidiphilum MH1-52-1]
MTVVGEQSLVAGCRDGDTLRISERERCIDGFVSELNFGLGWRVDLQPAAAIGFNRIYPLDEPIAGYLVTVEFIKHRGNRPDLLEKRGK